MLLRTISMAATAVATILLAFCFVTFPASRVENANAYFQPGNIRASGLVGTRTLALTFDDGPSGNTGELLEALAAYKIRATFFVVGSRVRLHPDVMERMARDGHVIANHSYSHAQLGHRYAENPKLLTDQVGKTNDAILRYAQPGQGFYFRAPYGVWRSAHAEVLNADPVLKNYVGPVYWDIGGEIQFDDEDNLRSAADWDCWSREWTAEKCGRGYMREIARKKGGIVLMHDIRERSVVMIRDMIPQLIADGYQFVTLDEVKGLDQFRTPIEAPVSPDVPVADAGSPPSTALLQH